MGLVEHWYRVFMSSVLYANLNRLHAKHEVIDYFTENKFLEVEKTNGVVDKDNL